MTFLTELGAAGAMAFGLWMLVGARQLAQAPAEIVPDPRPGVRYGTVVLLIVVGVLAWAIALHLIVGLVKQ